MYSRVARRGFARPGARRSREDFEICATAQVVVTDDRPAIMELVETAPGAVRYGRGWVRRTRNFHAEVPADWLPEVVDASSARTSGRTAEEAAKGDLMSWSTIRRSSATWTTCVSRSWPGRPRGVTMMVVGARSVEQIDDLAALADSR